jgi:protease-4
MNKIRHPVTGCRVDTLLNDIWLVRADILQTWVDVAFKFDLKDLVVMAGKKRDDGDDEEADDVGYEVNNGIAVMHVRGGITKYPTSFGPVMGGTSCVGMRRALQHMVDNQTKQNIKAAIIQGESHGGTADGVDQLNRFIQRVDAQNFPVFGYADDVSTSAMYWILSGTREIGANTNALVGSVGGMTALVDTSKKFEQQGIKVVPIATGTLKAVGAPGVEITEPQIKYIESILKAKVQPFFDAVQKGRKLTTEQLKPIISTAETVGALQGKEIGLVDTVCDLDEFIDRVRSETVHTTVSIPGQSGGSGDATQIAAQTGRSIMELSATQLATIQSVCGDSKITKETALDALLARATGMNTEVVNNVATIQAKDKQIDALKAQIPVKTDTAVLDGLATVKTGFIELEKGKGVLSQAQADHLSKLVTENKQLMVGTNLSDNKTTVIDAMLGTMKMGANTGITNGAQTGSQLQPHVATGGSTQLQGDAAAVEATVNAHLGAKTIDYDPFHKKGDAA